MIDNDLIVGGRQQVMQNARFKRDVFIEGTLFCHHVKDVNTPAENEPMNLETEISVDTKDSLNPPTTKAVYDAIDSVQGDVDVNTQDIDALTERVSALEAPPQPSPGGEGEAADARLYPEYYGAVGDGIDYYNWPLRCFNGTVTVSAGNIQSGTYNAKVFAPAERIAYRYTNMPAFISTDQVVFNTTTKQFLLAVNNGGTTLYYSKWDGAAGWNSSWDDAEMWDSFCGSSVEWNDEDRYDADNVLVHTGTGKARTDTVYSDIAPDLVNVGKLKRISYVFKNEALVDILTTMTNDEAAIDECIRKTKGNMRLHKGKIYFMLKTQAHNASTTPYRNCKDFVTDGQGGTIFARSSSTVAYNGSTGGYSNNAVFKLEGCERGTIKNINIVALRDRDNGAPSGHRRFSSSCSRQICFDLGGSSASKDLAFKDINLKGFYSDFSSHLSATSNIVIDGYKSEDLIQNWMAAMRNVTIKNFDVTQNGFCGDGMHLVYGSSRLRNVFFGDGKFDVNVPFTSVMLTFHGTTTIQIGELPADVEVDTDSTIYALPTGIHFSNVDIAGGKLLQGNAIINKEPQHIHLRNCKLVQKFDKVLTSSGTYADLSTIYVGSGTNFDFDSCTISLSGAALATYNNESKLTLKMSDCSIFTKDTLSIASTTKLISGFKGTLVTDGVVHNWPGPLGVDFTKSVSFALKDLKEMGADLGVMKSDLYGEEPDFQYSTDEEGVYPTDARLGDYVFNVANNRVEICTEVAQNSRFSIQCGTPDANAAISGTLTIKTKASSTDATWTTHDVVAVEIPQGEVTTSAELGERLKELLIDTGYNCGNPTSSKYILWVEPKELSIIGNHNSSCISIEWSSDQSGLIYLYPSSAVANSDGVTGSYLKYYRKGSYGVGTALVVDEGIKGKVEMLTPAPVATAENITEDAQIGYSYFNTTFNSNMVLITQGVVDNDTTKRIWRNMITGKVYEDDNTEFPSAADGSECTQVVLGFVYYNTTINAFVECTAISGGDRTWNRKETAEIINPDDTPIPESGQQQHITP